MNKELSDFAAKLRLLISHRKPVIGDELFSELALELFALQFQNNSAYQKICRAKNLPPSAIDHWTQIPAVPTSAFKELELTAIPPNERAAVFHSSGTTEQKPSRHFHSAESLAVYEASLLAAFEPHCFRRGNHLAVGDGEGRGQTSRVPMFMLTPPAEHVPHSSLVHMLETVGLAFGFPESAFLGRVAADGSWTLDFPTTLLNLQSVINSTAPVILFGTAFSFVHLLDFMAENNLQLRLPDGSRVMETGGYKNRSRSLPKAELHALITGRLGVPRENILCEYGMSELSSQAYDSAVSRFHFPSWARVQIISPETGREVAEGETGLIRIFDLANIFSVAAIQTEDLGVRRGDGFELLGRLQLAEPRGCSLMNA